MGWYTPIIKWWEGVMGAEEFQVVLRGDNENLEKIVDKLKEIPHLSVDKETRSLAKEVHFLINDGVHIIEIEVSYIKKSKGPIRISFRFALCHPHSIDDAFYSLLIGIGKKLNMNIEIIDEVPSGYSYKFNPPHYRGLYTTLKKSIEIKRHYWVQDFGPGIASLTPSDAIIRFIINMDKE